MAKRSKNRRRRNQAAARLTDDLIVQILSRLPVKSLCRCKCVSTRWRGLISHPDHRRRLPQTLAGLFYITENPGRFPAEARHFTNIWDWERRRQSPPLICPSLSFIPGHEHISIQDSCNGLLLCRRPESTSFDVFCYVVCNPATESWVVLPHSGSGGKFRAAWLGFDPAVSSHFHVFEFVDKYRGLVAGMEIYSSQTGSWSYKESQWNFRTSILGDESGLFFNGLLHLVIAQFAIVAVDVEGEKWWMTTSPEHVNPMFGWDPGFVGRYQDRLCYINQDDYDNYMSIWVLENYATEDWILKHRVSIRRLTEKIITPPSNYHVITIHPDCNWILYAAGWDQTLMAYDVDHEEVHVIRNLGSDSSVPYIPYVPLYSGSLTDGH
ncbi:hypothetical protein SEVIR_9G406200v4 [Setaria viridis]|uniref:F-box domain-containing protein n=1 Tax=Setaria viridis TaxID=4556 RepID=A0A4U6T6I6_SETVI|nr:F-box protein At5g07610-like [Setaria viridis]TKV96078.1 hypothetical protein SEVIR_9G406200v2 [Setaria viridis]